ncbi:Nitrogen regulation protein NtrC, partial [Bathymodiolus heckerae thiotrophic gill symbiont]|uniref:response regulator n=1 Tax=Bathymodiolus heckerae thiotrophic gill symbiont TaxID=1052212 RepID=UPI0010B292BD
MTKTCQVWISDDDKSIRWVIEKALTKNGSITRSFASAQELLKALESDTPGVLLSDIRMPGLDGLQLLKKLQSSHPLLPVIIMTAHSDLESAVAAFHI